NKTTAPLNPLKGKIFSPLLQAVCALAIGLLGVVITKLAGMETYYQFVFAYTGIVIYCLANTIVSIFHDSFVRYTLVSWWIYAGLVIVLLLAARFVSGVSIREHREFIQMLISLTIFYVMASLIVRGICAILYFIDN